MPIRVIRPAVRHLERTIRVTATVEAGRRTEITPEVSGIVAAVFKDEGDRVQADEPLFALDDEDFRLALAQAAAQRDRAAAAVAQATANLAQARSHHHRAARLHDRGILPPTERENSESALRVAEAALQATRAEQKVAATGVARAEKALRDTVARAPFAGRVVRRLVDEGALIRTNPPTIAMVVVETDPVRIHGTVGEYDAATIRPGLPVTIAIDALSGPALDGKVEMVSPVLDPSTRTARLRVTLPNPAGDLMPGMAASLLIDLGAVSGMALPRDVFTDLGKDTGRLLVVGEDLRAAAREVQIRTQTAEWVIVGEGLHEDDRVIGAGQGNLHGGERVEIVGERS